MYVNNEEINTTHACLMKDKKQVNILSSGGATKGGGILLTETAQIKWSGVKSLSDKQHRHLVR